MLPESQYEHVFVLSPYIFQVHFTDVNSEATTTTFKPSYVDILLHISYGNINFATYAMHHVDVHTLQPTIKSIYFTIANIDHLD